MIKKKKIIEFIEKKNKPIFDVELLMENMIDKLYDNLKNYYIENNINDIILIDPRLDIWRNKLIGFNFYNNEFIDLSKKKYIYAFNKYSFNVNYGFLINIRSNFFYILGKNDTYKIDKNNCYIFYVDMKTKKEKENDSIRNFVEDLINNKIKIKKKKKNIS